MLFHGDRDFFELASGGALFSSPTDSWADKPRSHPDADDDCGVGNLQTNGAPGPCGGVVTSVQLGIIESGTFLVKYFVVPMIELLHRSQTSEELFQDTSRFQFLEGFSHVQILSNEPIVVKKALATFSHGPRNVPYYLAGG